MATDRKGNIHNEGIIVYETGFQRSCIGRKKASGRVWIRDARRQYRECWGIGAHKNGDCTIAEGTYKGTFVKAVDRPSGAVWK